MKRLLAVSILFNVFFLPGHLSAQKAEQTPAQKTKEAVEKFKRVPEAVRERLDALRGRSETKGPGPSDRTLTGEDSLTVPTRKAQPVSPRYSPLGRPDPFVPFALRTKAKRERRILSPLERYETGQLKLVAIVWDDKEPRAMVEDAAGLGYIIKPGTSIGTSEGKVKAIQPTEVVIEESYLDFYGQRKSREVRMKLPAE